MQPEKKRIAVTGRKADFRHFADRLRTTEPGDRIAVLRTLSVETPDYIFRYFETPDAARGFRIGGILELGPSRSWTPDEIHSLSRMAIAMGEGWVRLEIEEVKSMTEIMTGRHGDPE